MSSAATPLSVTQFNRQCQAALNDHVGTVWLKGEISNFASPSSGHWYFTLKDDKAQIRAAMFKGKNRLLKFRPGSGDEVIVKAKVAVFEPRGDLQVIVEFMEQAGAGRLEREFEALKQKLQSEGLFDASRKLALPPTTLRLGVVTSPSGAALHDILQVLRRRFPLMHVIIYPSQVQGKEAPQNLIKAIKIANKRQECDALLLTRGGGSREDLWAFNDERLARTIAESKIPLVSAVGHEVDFTIADFVADLRAPTPSSGAELLCPDKRSLQEHTLHLQKRLIKSIGLIIATKTQLVDLYQARLVHPKDWIAQKQARVRELSLRLRASMLRNEHTQAVRLSRLVQSLRTSALDNKIQAMQFSLRHHTQRLKVLQSQQLERCKNRLALSAEKLHGMSPLRILARGYSLTQKQNKTLCDVRSLQLGDEVETTLSVGRFTSQVTKISEKLD